MLAKITLLCDSSCRRTSLTHTRLRLSSHRPRSLSVPFFATWRPVRWERSCGLSESGCRGSVRKVVPRPSMFTRSKESHHHVTVTPIRVLAKHERVWRPDRRVRRVGSALLTPPLAPAQGFGSQSAVAQEIKIKSPVALQVFQRNVNRRAVDKMKQIHAAENWIAIRARSARWFGQGASRRSA